MLSYVLEDEHAIHETTVYYVMRWKIWDKAKRMFSAWPSPPHFTLIRISSSLAT